MELVLLRSTPYVTIFYDRQNDWLFIDWVGDLTLPIVKTACVEIAQCHQARVYSLVLNSNVRVKSVTNEVIPWLTHIFLPKMQVAGIEYVAWVHPPVPRGLELVQYIVSHSPLNTAAFSHLHHAIAWLQQVQVRKMRVRTSTAQLLLNRLVEDFTKQVALETTAPPSPV
jgi:hypothetical protein